MTSQSPRISWRESHILKGLQAVVNAMKLLSKSASGMFGFMVLVFFLLLAVFGPVLMQGAMSSTSAFSSAIMEAPSAAHWLGTDDNGRDVLGQLAVGARVSITVGFAAAFVSMVIGAAVGITAGLAGGWLDRILSALDNFFIVIPFLPLAVVLTSLLSDRANDLPGGRMLIIIFVIGFTLWAGTARIIRSQVVSIKERQFIERVRSLGASEIWIARKHILPNVMPLLMANTMLIISSSILTESALAFLGLGDPLNPSWGAMLDGANDAGALTQGAWWWFLPPGLCIVLLVLAFNLVGRAMEEILNPRLGETR